MGTFIKSIAFQNFYNYYGDFKENIYTFKEGINIINADNNMGKSKFYNGFLWLLRDNVYDSDDDVVRLVSDSWSKMMSGRASHESNDFVMGVQVNFENDGVNYKVTKHCRCVKDGETWNYIPGTDVTITDENEDLPIMDADRKQDAIRKMIPADMEKYSLLQGESMEQLVDLSSKDGLVRTINALADINNLIQMCALANDLVAEAKKSQKEEEKKNNSANSELTQLQQDRDNYEKWIDDANAKISIAREECTKAKEEEQRIESEFLSSKKRLQLGQEYKRELGILDNLKNEKEKLELSVTSRIFDENCPWLLMGLAEELDEFDELRTELVTAITTENIKKNPEILLPKDSPDTPSLKRMLDRCHCEVCDREAPKDSAPWLHIKKLYDRPRKAMHASDSFLQFYGDMQMEVGRYRTTIPTIAADYDNYLQSIYDLGDQIEAQQDVVLKKQDELALVGAEDSSEDHDRKILSDYNQARATIKAKNDLIQKYTNNIKLWESNLEKVKKDIERKQNSAPVKKAEEIYNTLVEVQRVFENTKERIFNEIVSHLQDTANTMYKGLTNGSQTLGGVLQFERQDDGTVRVNVLNAAGEELTGNGKGFKRMKQLAIVMSIISSKIGNKRFDYPFISDAPFSEFGANLINNFLSIAPGVFRQSIIMIKDLSDSTQRDLITPAGKLISEKMKSGEIKGTFYVNYNEELEDSSNMATKKMCYSE